MKTKACSGLGITPPAKGAFTIETDPDFFKLHCLALFSGKRGGGKSVACANIVKIARDRKYFDRVWLITPTYASNKEIWNLAGITQADVLEPSVKVLDSVIAAVEQDADEWEQFLEDKREFERLQRDGPDVFDPMVLLGMYDRGWLKPTKPKWKYAVERPPRLGLIIDDCMGTDLLKPGGGLTRFCIAHRHWGRGLGISVFMLVQSNCSTAGIARPIREQCTLLCLFRLRDGAQRLKLLDEADLGMTPDQFDKIAYYAWSKPYGFLTIDFAPKNDSMRFRSGFNEIMVSTQ
jgi:hypothetical protein